MFGLKHFSMEIRGAAFVFRVNDTIHTLSEEDLKKYIQLHKENKTQVLKGK